MAFISAGVMTIRNGHIVMFIIGFIFPILWIVGAFMDKPRISWFHAWPSPADGRPIRAGCASASR
jgi:hypothetical protein